MHHAFIIRIDYINSRGENHYTYLCGSEPFGEGSDLLERMRAHAEAYGRLKREILQIQKIEHVAYGLDALLNAIQPVDGRPAMNDGLLRLVKGGRVAG